MGVIILKLNITEKRNSNSMKIDQMGTEEILKLINEEDAKVASAVYQEIPNISRAIDKISYGMKRGGRLIYVGAGTSGRLGVLDAVECVPTFGVEDDRVVGILAGGQKAMFKAQEDIEDDYQAGIKEINKYNIKKMDSVVGIAASGKTPFVLGAIDEAIKRGATTIGIICNKDSELEKKVEIAITPIVGPEIITGSTRMKAGTAQKMVLNMISTTVMIKLGKIYSNLMIDLKATNKKLKERAKDIFMEITNEDYQIADHYLKKANYSVKESIVMYYKDVDLKTAKELLSEKDGRLNQII